MEYYNTKLVRLLKRYRLYDASVWVNQSSALVEKKEMVEVKHNLVVRRQKLRSRIEYSAQCIREYRQEIERMLKKYKIEDMNIRTAPDESSELAGKFYRGDVAEIVSVEGEWTQIVSGNATGYVKNEYLVYGNEANELANEVCSLYATVNTDGLRLRSEPNEEAGIVTTAGNGDKLKVDKTAEATEGWIPVHTSDATAYVSADYVEVALNLGTALNSERS